MGRAMMVAHLILPRSLSACGLPCDWPECQEQALDHERLCADCPIQFVSIDQFPGPLNSIECRVIQQTEVDASFSQP